MNIDWSEAPEDATHAGSFKGKLSCWYKLGSGWAWEYMSGLSFSWEKVSGNLPAYDLIERPKKQEAWDGEGLPQVGTECEWKEKSGFQWVAATILFITESSVVCKRSDGFEWQMPTKRTVFRPIKTAEQLVEEEIQAIRDEIRWQKPQLGPCPVAQLYHKGYRKQ